MHRNPADTQEEVEMIRTFAQSPLVVLKFSDLPSNER